MYKKKIVFSLATIPATVFVQQLAQYQQRAREDKENETQRRSVSLNLAPVDITPKNKGHFLWSSSKNLDQFEQEWSMKPVSVTGIFDHSREIMVEKMYKGEKGAVVITPFYTHLDGQENPQAILVNRGWVPHDLRSMKLHQKTTKGTISGILYRGDALTKWSVANSPTIERYDVVKPSDIAAVDQLANYDEASQFMLHQVDFDEDARQELPTAPTVKDLQTFRVSAERHYAYESLWRYLTFAGVLANTAVWLYI